MPIEELIVRLKQECRGRALTYSFRFEASDARECWASYIADNACCQCQTTTEPDVHSRTTSPFPCSSTKSADAVSLLIDKIGAKLGDRSRFHFRRPSVELPARIISPEASTELEVFEYGIALVFFEQFLREHHVGAEGR